VRSTDHLLVERGEMLAFIGPNGAGKSTTISSSRVSSTHVGLHSGARTRPARERKALARRIGTVFGQRSQLWYHLPPWTRCSCSPTSTTWTDQARVRIASSSRVRDQGLLRTPVRKLSLGERIRCEIAASLLHRRDALPRRADDRPHVIVKASIRDLIRRMNDEERTTVFLTSHDAGDIEKICRRASSSTMAASSGTGRSRT